MNTRVMIALVVGLLVQVACGDDEADGGDIGGNQGVDVWSRGAAKMVGNGQRTDDSRTLDGFVRVTSGSALQVDVQQAAAFSVVVSIDDNLLGHVTTAVRGDTLVIDTNGSFETKLVGPHIRVTLPHLESANNLGSGDLSVATVESGELALSATGAGNVHFAGSAPKLEVNSAGSGDASLKGAAPDLTIRCSGSGDVDATELTTTTAAVRSSGSGDVTITASGTASTNLTGSGDIEIHGGAQVHEGARSGSGEVTQP